MTITFTTPRYSNVQNVHNRIVGNLLTGSFHVPHYYDCTYQVRIKIECAFGMLVNRWGILRKAMPAGIGLKKTGSLVMCLCRLHNFCIEHNATLNPLDNSGTANIAPALAIDNVDIRAHRGLPYDVDLEPPEALLGGGEHFDDVTRNARREMQARAKKKSDNGMLPREALHNQVRLLGLKRPMPKQWEKPAKSA